MKLVLATGSDKKYYHKILPYLDSVQKNSNFDENYLIYMDEEPIKSAYKKIKVSHMLKEYCKDLCAEVRAGHIDPVRCP